MKIAIIGAGISGLTSAYLLHKRHQITLFEANDYLGGHTNTQKVVKNGRDFFVDTGFIVFNKKNYPNFLSLIESLGVSYTETKMSFSVSNEMNGLEYNGTNLNSLFADRRNLFKPSFYFLLKEILSFNQSAKQYLRAPCPMTLRDFFSTQKIKNTVVENYLTPMIASVWSTDPQEVLNLPAKFILDFFRNHGFLEVQNRPQWYVIKGGSHTYVKKIVQGFEKYIRINCPVKKIKREGQKVLVQSYLGTESFDAIILATHSDISLSLLSDPSHAEVEILSAISYSKNEAYLHQDRSFLPRRKRAWAAWNSKVLPDKFKGASLTYNMNILQGFPFDHMFNVTLNPHVEIKSNYLLKKISYHHPLFTLPAMAAQSRWQEISGKNNTFYCGAYWRNGFHEDGVVSALRVVDQLEKICSVKSTTVG